MSILDSLTEIITALVGPAASQPQTAQEDLHLSDGESLDVEIARIQAEIKRLRKRLSLGFVGTVAVTVVGSVLVYLVFGVPALDKYPRVPILLIVFCYGLFLSFYFYVTNANRVATREADLEVALAKRKAVLRLGDSAHVEGTSAASYFDSLVKINVENLAAYYTLVKVHTNKSFTVSIAVGLLGILLIMSGLVIGFISSQNAKAISYVSAGSGVVMEFISGVFFYLYNRTVQQLRGYHDSLLSVQNVLLSFKLVDDTKNDTEKAKMVTQMLTFLVGKRVPAQNVAREPRHPKSVHRDGGSGDGTNTKANSAR
jgi:hypothetical protein